MSESAKINHTTVSIVVFIVLELAVVIRFVQDGYVMVQDALSPVIPAKLQRSVTRFSFFGFYLIVEMNYNRWRVVFWLPY